MPVRLATEADLPAIVETLCAEPSSPGSAWLFAEAADPIAERVSWMQAVVRGSWADGAVLVDGSYALGGGPSRITPRLPGRRLQGPAHDPTFVRDTRSGDLVPTGISRPTLDRRVSLVRAIELVRPPFDQQQLTVWTIGPWPDPLWDAWLLRSASLPTVVIGTIDGDDEHLVERGFRVIAEQPEGRDGRPAMRSWVRHVE